jgi:hypothetical protein
MTTRRADLYRRLASGVPPPGRTSHKPDLPMDDTATEPPSAAARDLAAERDVLDVIPARSSSAGYRLRTRRALGDRRT